MTLLSKQLIQTLPEGGLISVIKDNACSEQPQFSYFGNLRLTRNLQLDYSVFATASLFLGLNMPIRYFPQEREADYTAAKIAPVRPFEKEGPPC